MVAVDRSANLQTVDPPVAPATSVPGHLYAIDFARGLAALVVLVWHYQHFFLVEPGNEALQIPRDQQPFYGLLWPFYHYGFFAVQFFWMISGFVFTAVYVPKRVGLRDFSVNRLARLYPLHLLTLFVVLALQFVSVRVVGYEQIYANNDLWHLVLNILFASHWGLERGYSFNGPIWSVSIEILIYALFFAILPVLYRRGAIGPVALAVACWAVHYHSPWQQHDEDFFRGAFYFFEGSAVFLLFSSQKQRPMPIVGLALVLTAAGLLIFALRPHSTDSVGMPLFLTGLLLIFQAVETAEHGRRFKTVRWFGDNTYGTYLWHVPIQIALLIGLDGLIGDRTIALSPWFFLGFLALVIAVSRVSFIYFEAPARERIRRLAR